MREGNTTIGDTTQSSSGYFKLASGTSAQRPNSAGEGMMRYNSTLGYAEIYQQGIWQKVGLGDSSIDAKMATLSSGYGSLLFVNVGGGLYLNPNFLTAYFENPSVANLSWVYINDSITDAAAGYSFPVDGYIVSIIGYYTGSYSGSLSLYINDTEYANALVLAANTTATQSSTPGNVYPFNANDKVRLRFLSNTAGNLGALYVALSWQVKLS